MLYLIRHGRPHRDNIILGQTDISIDQTIRRGNIKLPLPDKIIAYCSPQKQSKQTAELLGCDNYVLDERLREIDLGIYTGQIRSQENLRKVEEILNENSSEDYQGESLCHFKQRVLSFYEDIKNQNAIVITHKGVIQAIMALILRLTTPKFDIEYLTMICLEPETLNYKTHQIIINST